MKKGEIERQGADMQQHPQPAHGTDLSGSTHNNHREPPRRSLGRLQCNHNVPWGVEDVHVFWQEGLGGPMCRDTLIRPQAGIVAYRHCCEKDNVV